MEKTILVIRHGQAQGNSEHRFIGQTNVALSTPGYQQAEALANRLAGQPITGIVSSDLSRCVDTVTPLADKMGLGIETDARLREISNGEWSGRLPEEIAADWPGLWQRYVGGEDVPRPGGERWTDVRARTLACVNELVDRAADGETILVCTHGGPALHLVTWAAGVEPHGNIFKGTLGPIANGSISTLAFPGPRLLGYNDVGHLRGELTRGRPPYLPTEP